MSYLEALATIFVTFTVILGIWSLARDVQLLRKSNEGLAWDNERSVLIKNCEQAERDACLWQKAHDELAAVLQRTQLTSRTLRQRLEKHGIDPTE